MFIGQSPPNAEPRYSLKFKFINQVKYKKPKASIVALGFLFY